MIKTPICGLLGIEYPIIQGAMAWIADASLASAVSNAGGLGIIAAMNSNYDQLTAEIKKIKKMTSKPYGVNIMLMSPYAAEAAQAVVDQGVPVLTTGAGSAARFMRGWLDAGIKVLPVIPSTAAAKMAVKSGATAIIAEGCEAGGHIGELTTMALVPQIADVVSVPVIAAGGIADGRQLAAAFMLGAQGVQVGTRFLSAFECTVSKVYKQRILEAKDIDTMTTGRRLGHPVRSLKTQFMKELAKMEYDPAVSAEEIEKRLSGSLRLAAREGNVERGSFMAGQVAAMVKREQSSSDIIREMFTQAEDILSGACKWIK
jgi:enoyl-[acyl-carrier protein] reductase II